MMIKKCRQKTWGLQDPCRVGYNGVVGTYNTMLTLAVIFAILVIFYIST